MNRTSRSVVRPGSPDLNQIEDEEAQLQRGMKQFKTIEQQEQREEPEGLRLSPDEERALSPDEELLMAAEHLEAAHEANRASSGPVREGKTRQPKKRQTKKATMQRASRMAPRSPPTMCCTVQKSRLGTAARIERRGGTRLVAEDLSRSFRTPAGSGGKGPAVPSTADDETQATVAHVVRQGAQHYAVARPRSHRLRRQRALHVQPLAVNGVRSIR